MDATISAGTRTPTINTVAVTTTDLRLIFEGPTCNYNQNTIRKYNLICIYLFMYIYLFILFEFIILELIVNRLIVIRTGLSLSCISRDPMSNV